MSTVRPTFRFQVGGALSPNAPSYIWRAADRELYQALLEGEFCYILNARQMGKSSLRVQTMRRLRAVGVCCGAVDLTAIGIQQVTLDQWYASIVGSLVSSFQLQIDLRIWWRDRTHLSPVQRLSEFVETVLLQAIDFSIVIFIDEIDSVLSLKFPTDDFFAFIRACYNKRAEQPAFRRLSFALLGVATPSDLIADKTQTPFNLGRAIELKGFQLREAMPLITGFKRAVDNPQAVLAQILYWTGGQPLLTQKLCQIVLAAYDRQSDYPFKDLHGNRLPIPFEEEACWVQRLVYAHIINYWERQDEPEHLRTIRDRLLKDRPQARRVLGLYWQILNASNLEREKQKTKTDQLDAETAALIPSTKDLWSLSPLPIDNSPEESELLLSGLVEKQQNHLRIKNRIYQEVFNLDWLYQQFNALRPYSQALEDWIGSAQQDASRLLRGQALLEALEWSHHKNLSNQDYQFLTASQEQDRREVEAKLEAERLREVQQRLADATRNTARQQLLLILVSAALAIAICLGLTAYHQYQQTALSRVRAIATSAAALFASDQNLDALVTAVRAKRALDRSGQFNPSLQSQVEGELQQAIYGAEEFNRLSGHQGWVLAVETSPDGQMIATGSNDQTVKLWRPDGTLLHTLNHSTTVHALAFSPDSQRLISSSLDGKIYLWSREGQLLRRFQAHKTAVWDLVPSPDGQQFASASEDGKIYLWSLQGALLQIFEGHRGGVWGIAFSPDGRLLASSSQDQTIKLWKTSDGTLINTLKGHLAAVWDVKFALFRATDGTQQPMLVSASGDQTIKLWDLDGTLLKTLAGHQGEVFEVAVRDDGGAIASVSGDQTIKLWNLEGTLLNTFKGHLSAVRSVAFLPNSSIIVSASDDNTARLWNSTSRFVQVLRGHRGAIWDLDFSPDGQMLASASTDGSFKLWARDGTWVRSFDGHRAGVRGISFISGMNWGTDEPVLASASADKTIKIWRLDGTLLDTLTGHTAGIWDVTFNPERQIFASASDDETVKLWKPDGSLLRTLEGHQARVYDVDFSPDGQSLVSSSEDGTARQWSLTGQPLRVFRRNRSGIWEVAISPNGKRLATASLDDTIQLWRPNGTVLATLHGGSLGMTSVHFSPDGKMLAAGGATGNLELWHDSSRLTILKGHKGGIWDVRFSPDGRWIASSGEDQTVKIWDVEQILELDELPYACDWISDYLRTNAKVEPEDRHLCDRPGARSRRDAG